MPANPRPSALYINSGWADKSLADLQIAQNQWDLLEAQERANELAEARLNALLCQQDDDMEEIIVEQHDEENEKYNKCNELGVDYDNIKQLFNIITTGDIHLYQQILDMKMEISNITEKIKHSIFNTRKLEARRISLEEQVNEFMKEQVQSFKQVNDQFIKFREHHYNEEFEKLFKDIGINLPEIKPINTGTISDYNNYIKTVIGDN